MGFKMATPRRHLDALVTRYESVGDTLLALRYIGANIGDADAARAALGRPEPHRHVIGFHANLPRARGGAMSGVDDGETSRSDHRC